MARENKLGTPFLNLFSDKDEAKKVQEHLEKKGWSGKRYLRFLVRQDLGITVKLNIKHGK